MRKIFLMLTLVFTLITSTAAAQDVWITYDDAEEGDWYVMEETIKDQSRDGACSISATVKLSRNGHTQKTYWSFRKEYDADGWLYVIEWGIGGPRPLEELPPDSPAEKVLDYCLNYLGM